MGGARSKVLLAVCATAGLFIGAAQVRAEHEAGDASAKWHPWFEIGGYYNSDDASRGELTVFAPITQSHNSLAFIDMRGKFFDEDVKEGNFAVGYRRMTGFGFNLGAWIGGDVRHTSVDNTFWQLSGGFEALSKNFDARLNWYGPISSPQLANDADFTEVLLFRNSVFMVGGEEVGLKGVDAELGVRIPLEMMQLDPNLVELRVYGGGFYFDHEDALEEIAGGKARVELALNDFIPALPGSRLTAEYEFSYDDVREERHEVGARVRIPFSEPGHGRALASLSGQERRMVARLERDTDIVTAQSKRESVEDAITGTDFDRVAFVANGGSITNVSNASGGNTLIVVNGTVQGAQQVQGDQTVQGGGSTIQVRGKRTGAVDGFRAPGSSATVRSGAGNIITLLGNNTHIAGMGVDGLGTSGDGIAVGNDKSNIALTQNTIRNAGADGIDVGSRNASVFVQANLIANARIEGILFNDDNRNVIVDGNTITNPGSDGIIFDNNNQNIVISNNDISGPSPDDGIEFDNDNQNIVITGNTITGFRGESIEIENRNSNILIDGNVISGSGEGIDIEDDNTGITISNNSIVSTTQEGIRFDDRNTNISITGNTIVAELEGIEVDDFANGVRIEGNTITSVNSDGIFFDNDNTDIRILNNVISTPNGDGIDIDNRNTGQIEGNTVVIAGRTGIDIQSDNTFTIIGNTIGSTGINGLRMRDRNIVTIANNNFIGPFGAFLLDIDGTANVLSGDGNVSSVPVTCESGAFAGTVTVSGVVLQDGVPPCN